MTGGSSSEPIQLYETVANRPMIMSRTVMEGTIRVSMAARKELCRKTYTRYYFIQACVF